MDNMPDVPNWLQWLATISALTVILWGAVRYFWLRWLSYWWAKRNINAAKRKAEVLVQQYREALHLVDDDRGFQAISTLILSDFIRSGIFIAIGGGVILITDSGWVQIPIKYNGGLFIVGTLILLMGLMEAAKATSMRVRFIEPYTDWLDYHETTLARISSLLAKAELSDEQQASFIDKVVEVVDENLITLDEDIDEQQD